MKRIFPFILIVMMMFAVAPAQAADNLSGAESVRIPNGGPTFWVLDVEQGDTVTLRFSDYPVGRTYAVYIGLLGNDFGQGYLVGTLDPPTPGFARTFDIPDDIHVERNLAVMIIDWSDNSHGYLIFANNSGWDSNQYLSFHSVAHSGLSVSITS